MRRLAALGAVGFLLAACSSAPQRPDPTPLVQPAPHIVRVAVAWQQSLGAVRMPVQLYAAGNGLAVASDDGAVGMIDVSTGQWRWRARLEAPLSAGVGSDGQHVAVLTQDNEVVVLRDGDVLWRQRLATRSLTAPLVAGERVFVYALDRSVHAFDAASGARLWQHQRPGDPLTLAQQGVLQPMGDTLLVGQGAKLAGLDPLRGSVRWEVPIATPRGTNEIERLADLVGPVGRAAQIVCARAFQAAVGCVDTRRAVLLWSKASNGSVGLAMDADQVYGVDGTDRVTAYRVRDGEVAWSLDALRFRGLTPPVAAGDSVIVGDAQGYVHFLSRRDGQIVGRAATDGSGIAAASLLVGDRLVVLTRAGSLIAWRPE